MLGDIVDYGKLKFHRDRSATYTALSTLTFKIGLGVGGGGGLAIASLFGFVPSQGASDPKAMQGLTLGFIVLPIFLACLGLIFIVWTPIGRRRHQIIQRRLEGRVLNESF